MARTLRDLTYFTKAIIGMQPWKYDYTVHPISWRDELETEAQSKPLRIGLMSTDGMYFDLQGYLRTSTNVYRCCASYPSN